MKTFLAARYYEHIAQKYRFGDVDFCFLITATRKINCSHFSIISFFFFYKKMLHITVVMAQLVNSDSTVLITHSFASVRVCV